MKESPLTQDMKESTRTVVFRDACDNDGVGIRIDFKEDDKVIYYEYHGDLDYNMAIVDWVLFGIYKSVEDRLELIK